MAASLFLSPPPSNPIVRNPISTVSTKTLKAFSFNTNKSRNNNSETRSSSSDCSFSLGPFLSNDEGVKAPTAPWMRGPLILKSDEVLDLSKPRKKKNSTNAGGEKPDKSLTGKVSGGRGKKALKKILEGMGKLREIHDSEEKGKDPEKIESDILLGDLEGDENSKRGKRMPWEKDERMVFRRTKKEKVVTAAELCLDGAFLERLRGEAARMRKWEKVKKAGVTQAVVDQLHMIWKDKELAMLKFDLPLRRNMDRAREIVEVGFVNFLSWTLQV